MEALSNDGIPLAGFSLFRRCREVIWDGYILGADHFEGHHFLQRITQRSFVDGTIRGLPYTAFGRVAGAPLFRQIHLHEANVTEMQVFRLGGGGIFQNNSPAAFGGYHCSCFPIRIQHSPAARRILFRRSIRANHWVAQWQRIYCQINILQDFLRRILLVKADVILRSLSIFPAGYFQGKFVFLEVAFHLGHSAEIEALDTLKFTGSAIFTLYRKGYQQSACRDKECSPRVLRVADFVDVFPGKAKEWTFPFL